MGTSKFLAVIILIAIAIIALLPLPQNTPDNNEMILFVSVFSIPTATLMPLPTAVFSDTPISTPTPTAIPTVVASNTPTPTETVMATSRRIIPYASPVPTGITIDNYCFVDPNRNCKGGNEMGGAWWRGWCDWMRDHPDDAAKHIAGGGEFAPGETCKVRSYSQKPDASSQKQNGHQCRFDRYQFNLDGIDHAGADWKLYDPDWESYKPVGYNPDFPHLKLSIIVPHGNPAPMPPDARYGEAVFKYSIPSRCEPAPLDGRH